MTAGSTQFSQVDPKLSVRKGARFRDLGGFIAGRDVCAW
jgi:hypothetical protein